LLAAQGEKKYFFQINYVESLQIIEFDEYFENKLKITPRPSPDVLRPKYMRRDFSKKFDVRIIDNLCFTPLDIL